MPDPTHRVLCAAPTDGAGRGLRALGAGQSGETTSATLVDFGVRSRWLLVASPDAAKLPLQPDP
jgi:hypothetical protein